ncbi:MAG: hypothetical protein WCJ85_03375 [Chitinophagaceae bacterium]
MRIYYSLLLLIACSAAIAQNNLAANIIEGSKTLVDLIRVIKMPKNSLIAMPASTPILDSCSIKNIADICYKNISGNAINISLSRRTGNTYTESLSLKIPNNSQECLYELVAGIYKYKIEIEGEAQKVLINEGELKLNACEKVIREIKK